MATAIIILPGHYPAPLTSHSRSSIKTTFPSSFDLRRKPNPRFSPSSTTSSASSSFPFDQEEKRWLREEQRWLREEQRWIREEIRWRSERESLLLEISSLRLRLEARDDEDEKRRLVLAEAETVQVEEEEEVREEKGEEMVKEWKTLKMGSEGEDVREMQEALLELGFFSGEDDMEYSDFSSGTERAVKTWQASLGIVENGIMTAELLDRLFVKQTLGYSGPDRRGSSEQVEINVDSANIVLDSTNGALVSSLQIFSETKEAVIKEAHDAETEMSAHRVYLLGENRWEEPSRLRFDKSVEFDGAKSRTQCLTCRGEGKVMCTECDGSGEPNVEPQFLEWIGEGTKCPYCEGLGFIICDVCN